MEKGLERFQEPEVVNNIEEKESSGHNSEDAHINLAIVRAFTSQVQV